MITGLLPLLLTGCRFGGRAGDSSEAHTITARVENNLIPAVALTISLVPEQGERRTIGVVPPGSTVELSFPLDGAGDPHRLLAEPANGAGTVSRRFTLRTALRLQWNVGRNALDVPTRP